MPSLCFRNVCKQISKLHEAISGLLPQQQVIVSILMQRTYIILTVDASYIVFSFGAFVMFPILVCVDRRYSSVFIPVSSCIYAVSSSNWASLTMVGRSTGMPALFSSELLRLVLYMYIRMTYMMPKSCLT